jgi:DHA1 family bicyclomycin/chloramphenicol resistance-like MFS transporter
MDMSLPALPQIADDLSASAWASQLTLTAFLFGMAFGQLIIGPLSDALGRRRPFLAGLSTFGVASAACAAAPQIWVLVGCRFVQGVAAAAGTVIARAVVRDLFDGIAVAKFFAQLMLVVAVAPIGAPLFGAAMLNVTGWRGIFVALGLIGVGLLVAVRLFLPETLPREERRREGLRDSLTALHHLACDRSFVSYTLTLAFVFAAAIGYIAAMPFVLEDIEGVSPGAFALAFGVNAAGLIAMSQVGRRLLDYVDPRRIVTAALTIATAAGLTLLPVVVLSLGLGPLLVCLFVFASSLGLLIPNLTALALGGVRGVAGAASGLLGVSQFTAGAIAAPLVGLGGRETALPMAAVMAVFLVAAVTAFQLSSRRHPAVVAAPELD